MERHRTRTEGRTRAAKPVWCGGSAHTRWNAENPYTGNWKKPQLVICMVKLASWVSCAKIPSLAGSMPLSLGDMNIPRRVNTQITDGGVWPSKAGRKNHIGMVLMIAWGSIQHTQRAGRYPLQLEVMLQVKQCHFLVVLNLVFITTCLWELCTPWAWKIIALCSPALGYGTPLPACCSVRSATEQNWAAARKKSFPPLSFLRVQDIVEFGFQVSRF